jgi:hypothetical protein
MSRHTFSREEKRCQTIMSRFTSNPENRRFARIFSQNRPPLNPRNLQSSNNLYLKWWYTMFESGRGNGAVQVLAGRSWKCTDDGTDAWRDVVIKRQHTRAINASKPQNRLRTLNKRNTTTTRRNSLCRTSISRLSTISGDSPCFIKPFLSQHETTPTWSRN